MREYLPQCLASVERQSFDGFEVILVDDGSSDGSAGICDEWAAAFGGRARSFHKENGGASSARNYGLDRARGEYVYFLDADDYLSEDALGLLVDAADREKADVVVFEAKAVNELTGEISGSNYTYSVSYPTGSGLEMMKAMHSNGEFHFVIWALLLRRDFLTENSIRCIEGVMYEDVAYVFRVFTLAKTAAHLRRELYFRRFRPDSVMTSAVKLRNFDSLNTVCRDIIGFADENYPKDDAFARAYIVRQCMNLLNVYRALPRSERAKAKRDERAFKETLSRRGWFGSRALRMRCLGYAQWAAYRAAEKLISIIKR